MTAPNEAKSIWRARFGYLRTRDARSCAGLLAFAAGGRSGFVTRRRSSETIGVFTVRLDGRAPVVSGAALFALLAESV